MRPPEHLEALRRFAQLLAERVGPGRDGSHVRGREPLGGADHLSQTELQRELLPGPLGRVGLCRQQREGVREGGGGVVMGMAPGGLCRDLLPIADGP